MKRLVYSAAVVATLASGCGEPRGEAPELADAQVLIDEDISDGTLDHLGTSYSVGHCAVNQFNDAEINKQITNGDVYVEVGPNLGVDLTCDTVSGEEIHISNYQLSVNSHNAAFLYTSYVVGAIVTTGFLVDLWKNREEFRNPHNSI